MPIRDLKKWLSTLPSGLLEMLEFKADEVLGEIYRAIVSPLHEARISPKVNSVKSGYYRELNSLVKKVERGNIDLKTFDREATKIIGSNFEKAFATHMDPEKGSEYLKNAVNSEVGYAKQMARDLRAGTSKATRETRVERYAQALDSIAWNAKVESMPDDVEIDWVLGPVEHCDDCILVSANGPYSKATLPTVPRAGDTACHSNCRCRLSFREGDEEVEESVYWMQRKEPSLSEVLSSKSFPGKGVVPTRIQSLKLDNIYMRILYNTRMGIVHEKTKAIVEYVECLISENLAYRHPIPFDRPFTSRTIGKRVVDDLFRNSIDGKSLGLLKESLPKILDKFERDMVESTR